MSIAQSILSAITRISSSTMALLVVVTLALQAVALPDAEARSNRYCVGEYYGGFVRQCG